MHEFFYYVCPVCGCLQIEAPPALMKEYYPDNYYTHGREWVHPQGFKRMAFRMRASLSKTFFYNFIKLFNQPEPLKWINITKINPASEILDVGCGNGDLLSIFRSYGFKNLTGIDPYLDNEFKSDTVNLFRQTIYEMDKKYDLIIFNHSLEHIWEQEKVLQKASELLKTGGWILARIPLVNYAFQKYKEYWVQLDAPRHFFLHTENSFSILCKKAGLSICNVVYDSTTFQFTGSEEFKAGTRIDWTEDMLSQFEEKAERLNKEKKGDQASFFLKKTAEKNLA